MKSVAQPIIHQTAAKTAEPCPDGRVGATPCNLLGTESAVHDQGKILRGCLVSSAGKRKVSPGTIGARR